ncbi:alpha-beta hydrolase superfamily lysophospholipase [Scopulibacillus daqui]|uniref:Alpha-beta hydrolase superfamily lysophospholipase n=1 Tax=Scopulibacillus daqui TaxID=1469162 RepID=A0ABS2Q152_9BACL|nr:alpha/beta fold hydrolase [Scopulibacillus daqui]MBM7645585.1 alpha-beta hydrolase superfamily lysophospholipase [Scopulibacillus daqui]
MERISFKNSRNKTLIGNLYHSASQAIIIMVHGFTSDKFSKGRFQILAEAFNQAGIAVLTFDLSGCGESDDDSLTVDKEVDDLNSAIGFVLSRGYQKIALYGHSLGSLICLKSWTPIIVTMVLSGALTDAMTYQWDEYFSREQMKELKERGYITIERVNSLRTTVIVYKQMLKDFEEINQKQLLEQVHCPVLIIHGNAINDKEECLLLQKSKKGMKYLPKGSELEVIDGADHRFLEHLDTLKELAKNWYIKHIF